VIQAEGAEEVTEERIAGLAREVIESRSRADSFGPGDSGDGKVEL
jgi:proteasome beta subunit